MKWKPPGVFYLPIGLCGVALILSSAAVANAQSTRPTPKDVVIESNRQELDNLLLRKPILTTEDNSARQAVLKQINEDFKDLQVLHNRLMTEITGTGDVDYEFVSNLISEIGSKASRLKSNLLLPKADSEKKDRTSIEISSAAEFKDRLIAFDKVVVSFATNPIFQKPNVIEVEPAKQASHDLTTVIEQSSKLKKAAARLAKIGK